MANFAFISVVIVSHCFIRTFIVQPFIPSISVPNLSVSLKVLLPPCNNPTWGYQVLQLQNSLNAWKLIQKLAWCTDISWNSFLRANLRVKVRSSPFFYLSFFSFPLIKIHVNQFCWNEVDFNLTLTLRVWTLNLTQVLHLRIWLQGLGLDSGHVLNGTSSPAVFLEVYTLVQTTTALSDSMWTSLKGVNMIFMTFFLKWTSRPDVHLLGQDITIFGLGLSSQPRLYSLQFWSWLGHYGSGLWTQLRFFGKRL